MVPALNVAPGMGQVHGEHLVMSIIDAGKLYDALAANAAVYCRVELVAIVEYSLHAAHCIQRHLQFLKRCP